MLVCHSAMGSVGGGKLGKARLPRVISEIRKAADPVRDNFIQFRPKISADLLVLIGSDPRWQPRRVQVRAGQLQLSPVQGCFSLAKQNDLGTRIPLRHLSLQAGSTPNSLALVRGKTILLTLQTPDERQFDLWVKLIAIEIIRQTPLEDVKYLDVFSLTTKEPTTSAAVKPVQPSSDQTNPVETSLFHSDDASSSSSYSPDSTASSESSVCTTCKPVIHFDEWDVNKNIVNVNNNIVTAKSGYADTVEVLLKKCQSSESYVPVKEKLMLFESLCRIGRGRSSEDVSMARLAIVGVSKRTRSLHDLTYCFTSGGVREICKYFETKSEDGGGGGGTPVAKHIKRLVHSDTSLNKVVFNRHFDGVSYA